jgi:acyl carrier protein
MQQLVPTVVAAIHECFPHRALKPTKDSRLHEDLDLDSLDFVELLMCLEDMLCLYTMREDADRCRTVGDLAAMFSRLQANPIERPE